METNEAMMKAPIIDLGKEFLIKKLGSKEALHKLYENAPEILKKYYLSDMFAVQNIPAVVMVEQFAFMAKTLGIEVFREGAAYAAFRDLGKAMKFFMKLGTPSFVAKNFPNAWSHYFNVGRFVLANVTSHSMELSLEDAQVYGEGGCQGTIGWTKMALEYSGAKNVKITQAECAFHGGKRCLLNYQWE